MSNAGRPEIGPATNVRLGDELTAKVDGARREYESRAAAIRRLLAEALEPVVVQRDEQTYEIPNYRIAMRAHGLAVPHHAEDMTGCTLEDAITRAKRLLADDLDAMSATIEQRTGIRKQRAVVATVYDRRRRPAQVYDVPAITYQ
jgi:Arc/MetJ-type ribon-helix-helix transcriptional regulator